MVPVEQAIFESHKETLPILDAFLANQIEYSQLRPFALPARYSVSEEKSAANFHYYLGTRSGAERYLRFHSPISKTPSMGDNLYVFPRQEPTKGAQPYYWLDFYESPPSSDEYEQPFKACRLFPEAKSGKIEFGHWHGLGEQLLADYVLGRNDISMEDLIIFFIQVPSKINLNGYRLAAERRLQLHLAENEAINDGDLLKIVPSQDDQQFFKYFDVLCLDSKVSSAEESLASSYRMFPDEHRISSIEWYGPQRQLLYEYFIGNPDLEPRNLRPILDIVTPKQSAVNLIQTKRGGKRLHTNLYYPSNALTSGEKIITVPKQDAEERYAWLELYKCNEESDQPEGKAITSGRLTREGIDQINWRGLERQLLVDFSHGEVPFEALIPIPLTRGKGDVISLWKENGKKVYLVLSGGFNLETGEELVLLPNQETENGAIFLLKNREITLAQYEYLRNQHKFILKNNYVVNKDLVFSFNRESNYYLDLDGNAWITKVQAVSLLRTSYDRLEEILHLLTPVRFKPQTVDKILTLYSESDLRETAEKHGINDINGWNQREYDFYPRLKIWVTRKDECDWTTRGNLLTLLQGITTSTLDECLDRVNNYVVRAVNGMRKAVFNIQEVLVQPEIKEFLDLPRVNKDSGFYQGIDAKWAAESVLAELVGIPNATLLYKGFLTKVRQLPGISRGRKTTLYDMDQLSKLPEVQEYLKVKARRLRVKSANNTVTTISPEEADIDLDKFLLK